MQQRGLIQRFDPASILQRLREEPISQKCLRVKLQRIFHLNSTSEAEYLPDVQQLYHWLWLFNREVDFREVIPGPKLQRFFVEEFLPLSIKYLILCKKFKLAQLMALTEQIILESIDLMIKMFSQLDKFPKMVNVALISLDPSRYFYKVNFQAEYVHLLNEPTKEDIRQNDRFVEGLKEGDMVDAFKIDNYTGCAIWSPAKIVRTSTNILVVKYEADTAAQKSISKSNLQVFPYGHFTKDKFDWRLKLKKGDKVDYALLPDLWKNMQIIETIDADGCLTLAFDTLETGNSENYQLVVSTSPNIQPSRTFSTEVTDKREIHVAKLYSEESMKDYCDILLDNGNFKGIAVPRPELCKSLDIIYFINHMHNKKFFDLVLDRLNPDTPLEVTIEMIGIIAALGRLFHRRFAHLYLPLLTDRITKYLLNSSEANIRSFTKEKLDMVFVSLDEFNCRINGPIGKRQHRFYLQPQLAKLFIESPFLERKLNSLSIISELIKTARHEEYLNDEIRKLQLWIEENKIIDKLYQEGAHSELISRSSDVLRLYLDGQPPVSTLDPLLELNQPIVKLIVQNIGYFPNEFLKKVADRIVEKNMPLDSNTLCIFKAAGDYESFLLSKGGVGWVEVVKEKKNKRQDLIELFKHPFSVVSKIYLDMIKTEYKFIQAFLKMAVEIDYAQTVLDNPNIDVLKKAQFLRPYYKFRTRIDNHGMDQVDQLWEQILQVENPPNSLFECFLSLLEHIEPNPTENFFKKHFSKVQDLRRISLGSFEVFRKLLLILSDKQEDEEQNHFGLQQIITIIFENNNLQVTKKALQLMEKLMDKEEREQVEAIKEGFMQKCLERLYRGDNHEKYLSILSSILNESQKNGNGNLQPMSKQLPPERFTYLVQNNFNELRTKFYLTVDSNLTLYELRHEIGKQVNGYASEVKLHCGSELLDQHLNAITLDRLKIDQTLTVSKKYRIEKVDLVEEGKLVADAVAAFRRIFDEYSSGGQMSKNDCKRLQKKMVGDSSFFAENKVSKIFSAYDQDKDDYLKFQEFLTYYEETAKTKPISVWNGLQALGIREDLKVLTEEPLPQPDPLTLPRYSLVKNHIFMELLFKLLKQGSNVAQAAWNMLSRLPVYTVDRQFDLNNNYERRYWLYQLDHEGKQHILNDKELQNVLKSDDETLAIGLKVTRGRHKPMPSAFIDMLMTRIDKIQSEPEKLTTYSKAAIRFALDQFAQAIESQPELQNEFIKTDHRFQKMLVTGLTHKKQQILDIYTTAVTQMFHKFNHKPELFEVLFKTVYENFQQGGKQTLSSDYFNLFSEALEQASNNGLLQRIGAQNILKTMVELFKNHTSTEKSLSSPQDHAAVGFMKIIGTMLNTENIPSGFVRFLFCQCLFPATGGNRHQLRSSTSRKQAYDLIYRLCKADNKQLDELFSAGFKKIYKIMPEIKISYYFKEVRSEWGYAGIRNLGCICYMISMLQQFYTTKPFRSLLLMAQDGEPQNMVKSAGRDIDDNLLHQLQQMFANLEVTEKQQYNPQDFCFAFKDFEGNPINVGVQQDAQQFLNMLFDRLEHSLKMTPFKHIAQGIYGGKYCNQFVCGSCKHVIERYQNFFSLSLEVKGQKNIHDSFKKFISGEVISDYKCDNCQKKTDTTKRSLVSQFPNYLILYLQRICFNYDKMENQKINTRWEFPLQLNLYDYSIDKQKGKAQPKQEYDYELRGIVVHIGTAEFGHYYSYIKTAESQWLEFNDERVCQFDPKYIESETFGGGIGWRKENQSAYLLVYEKVMKKPFTLEFKTEQEKIETLTKYNLKQVVEIPEIVPTTSESSQIHIENMEKEEEQKEGEPQAQNKITAEVNLLEIQPYVPENLKKEITSHNEQFTLHIQISSSEFMEFLYKISMLDPPQHIKKEFLQLCYECFSLKQTVGDLTTSIGDLMPQRFNELIKGMGWEFFQAESGNWLKDIFAGEKSTRIGVKKLIVAVLIDIENECSERQGESHTDQVKAFLVKLLQLFKDDEQDNWIRMQEYFELWLELSNKLPFVLPFLRQQNMSQLLLDYLLEHKSPLKFDRHRISSHRSYYTNDSTFQLLFQIFNGRTEFTENQLKCLSTYAFLEKLVNQVGKKPGFVTSICKNNPLISQRLAYSISQCMLRVTHSDESKPIIQAIEEALKIDDDMKEKRKEWIIGLPRLQYHTKTQSYGMYALPTILDVIYGYYSPLGMASILHIVNYKKQKYEHITILIVSMLLQLEHDGLIHLSDYPGVYPLQQDFTSWMDPFINNYHEEMMYPKSGRIPDNYKGYATRLLKLWKGRPKKEQPQKYLIGKTVNEVEIRTQEEQHVTITESQLTTWIAPAKYDENGALMHMKKFRNKNNQMYFTFDSEIIEANKNADMFLRKGNMAGMKSQVNTEEPSPFENAYPTDYLRKITFKNKGTDAIVLFSFKNVENANFDVPASPIRLVLQHLNQIAVALVKRHADRPWGNYDISCQVYPVNERMQSQPHQLITASPYEEDEQPLSDIEDDESFGGGYYE